MKKYFLLLTISLFSFATKAQLTADFPDSNYRWNVYYDVTNFELMPRSWVDGSFYDNGDSVINNKHYRKVFFKFTYFGDNYYWGPKGYLHGDEIYCLLRNDKQLKKCYIIRQYFSCNLFSNQQDSGENLLYDFNLKVGDLYPVTIHNYMIDSSKYITRIDTIIDPYNIKRAVYSINNLSSSIEMYKYNLIQGIGGISGLHFGLEILSDNLKHANLRCFKNNNIEMGLSNDFGIGLSIYNSICDQHIYSSVDYKKPTLLTISPNPVTSSFTIDIPDEEATFTLINTLGQSQEIQGVRENNNWKFEIGYLPNGIYFLNIVSAKHNYFSRFIKN